MYKIQKVRGFKKRSEDSKEERYQNGEMKQERRRFCHFWNNGRCRYKDSECWFVHEESPECKFGKECTVRRCMFYHPHKKNWSSEQYANYQQRKNWFSNQGKQHMNYNQKDNWSSKQNVNHQQRGNWSLNKGNPWNCLTSGLQRKGKNWV